MLNNVYFKPVEGVGSARTPKTEEERKKLEAQLEEKNRRDRAEHVRRDYEQAEKTRREQEARGDRNNFITNVAIITGASAVTAEVADSLSQQNQLKELFERSAQYNAIETPIVNQWASQSARLANNPYRDQQLLAAMIGPNGETRFADAAQAQDFFRHQALYDAIFRHYKVAEQTRDFVEQNLRTAREVIDQLFPADQGLVANQKVNEAINPTPTSQAQTAQQVQGVMDVRVSLHDQVARAAVAQGLQEEQAQQLAAEVSAAFVREQARRDQILLDLKEEQVRVQNDIKEVATKLEAAKQAEQQRAQQGDQTQRPTVNLDPSAQAALAEARKHGVELDPSGATKDPTKFQDGAYVDPNREQAKRQEPKVQENDQVAPVNIGRYDADASGRPVDDGVDLAQSGAAGVQAQNETGTRRGDHARTLSGTTKGTGVEVHGGPAQRDSARVLERNQLKPNTNL